MATDVEMAERKSDNPDAEQEKQPTPLKKASTKQELLERKQTLSAEKLEKLARIERKIRKHGVRYLGPQVEAPIHGLFSEWVIEQSEEEDIEQTIRYNLVHEVVKHQHHQVSRTWLELFTDLIFVAVIVKFANQMKENYKIYTNANESTDMWLTFGESMLFFFPFFVTWLELNTTMIRFADIQGGLQGALDDLLLFIFMSGICVVTTQIQSQEHIFRGSRPRGFVCCMLVCTFALFGLHALYYYYIPSAQNYCKRRMISNAVAFFFFALGFIPQITLVMIGLGTATMLYVSLLSFKVHPYAADKKNPLHKAFQIPTITMISNRFGIWTMIVLGESILAVMIDPEISTPRYMIVIPGFLMIYLLKLLYFGSHTSPEGHALNESEQPGSVVWVFLHLPLGYSLLSLGTGMKLLFFTAKLAKCPWEFRMITSVSLSCALSLIYYIRTAHETFIWSPISWLRFLPVFACPVGLVWTQDSFDMIIWCLIVTVYAWLFDVFFIRKYETKPKYLELEEDIIDFVYFDVEWTWQTFLYDIVRCNFRSSKLIVWREDQYHELAEDSDGHQSAHSGSHHRPSVVPKVQMDLYSDESGAVKKSGQPNQINLGIENEEQAAEGATEGDETAVGARRESVSYSDVGPIPGLHLTQVERNKAQKQMMVDSSNGSVFLEQVYLATKAKNDGISYVESSGIRRSSKNKDLAGLSDMQQSLALSDGPANEEAKDAEPAAFSSSNAGSSGGSGDDIALAADVAAKNKEIQNEKAKPLTMDGEDFVRYELASIDGYMNEKDEDEEEEEEDVLDLEHDAREEEHHEENTWFGEFSDLIFVAVIINFADQFKKMTTLIKHGEENLTYLWTVLLSQTALYFLAFFSLWYELSINIFRFTDVPGIVDDVLKVSYLLGIVIMGLNMNPKHYLFYHFDTFIVGFAICVGTFLFLHLLYYYNVPRSQDYCRRRIVLYAVCSVVLLFTVSAMGGTEHGHSVGEDTARILAVLFVSVMMLFYSSNSFRVVQIVKLNGHMVDYVYPEHLFEHVTERWGLIIMITMGESILALITSSDEDFLNRWEFYWVVICAFAIMFLMKEIYFESCNVYESDHAINQKKSPGSVAWTLLHGLLAFFYMLVGTSWKLTFFTLKEELRGDRKEPAVSYFWLLSLSQTMCFLLCYAIRATHDKFNFTSPDSVISRVILLVLTAISPVFGNNAVAQASIQTAFTAIAFGMDIWFIDIKQHEILQHKRKAYAEEELVHHDEHQVQSHSVLSPSTVDHSTENAGSALEMADMAGGTQDKKKDENDDAGKTGADGTPEKTELARGASNSSDSELDVDAVLLEYADDDGDDEGGAEETGQSALPAAAATDETLSVGEA